MKRSIYILFLMLALRAGAQTVNLTPDAVWADDNHRDWCDHGIGSATLGYNGRLYFFNYQGNGTRNGGHAYMYLLNENNNTNLDNVNLDDYKVGPSNDHDNRLEFKFPGEGSSYDEGDVLGRAFTFTYDGAGWFFMNIRSEYQPDHEAKANESYECYARLPATDDVKCFTYYNTTKPVTTVFKQGGFQLDSLMYFLAWNTASAPYHWEIQEYSYSVTTGKFNRGSNTITPTLPSQLPFLGGILNRLDTAGNVYLLTTFYDQNGNVSFGKFIPGIAGGKRTFSWSSVIGTATSPFTNLTGSSALSQGSLRAKRSASDMTNKTSGDRVFLFGENKNAGSDGNYGIFYIEYRVENDQFVKQAEGQIVLPSSYGPHLVAGHHQFYTGYQLFPKDNSTYLSGIDGFDQYVWIVYADQNRHSHGAMFGSDRWQMIDKETVSSPDLDNDDPVNGYEGISSLWTLSAIIDGPPPVSMNWHRWDSIYKVPHSPTEITLATSTHGGTEFMNSSENGWSIGETIKLTSIRGNKYKGNSEKFKYSVVWENSTTISNDTTVSYEQPLELFEEYQDYGRYIYIVPQMKRYSYNLYPWWDEGTQKYPVPGSFQYLFHTYNQFPKLVPKPLNSFPFGVAEPNGIDMSSWTLAARPHLDTAINVYDLHACMHLQWNPGNNGNSADLDIGAETVTTTSMTNSWEFEVEAGVATIKIPKVCQMEVYLSTGYEGSLTNETTTTTQFNKRISASCENLYSKTEGIQVNSLNLDGFILLPETRHWWYLDSCAGQTPWYLAWVVNNSYQSLINLSPANKTQFDPSGMIFSWQPDIGELYNYELFISKNPWVEGHNSVYRLKTRGATEIHVSDFRPEPGTTYYWSVRAFDAHGERIWSPVWSFSTPAPEQEPEAEAAPALKTVVCSNPGKVEDLRIIVVPETEGAVSLSIRTLSGQEVYRTSHSCVKKSVAEPFTFNSGDLVPGFYLAVITSGGKSLTRKIVIR